MIALVLVVTVLAVVFTLLRSPRVGGSRSGSRTGARSTRAVGPGASTEGLPAEAYLRHRWSERRPRLELTEGGIRRTGHQVRFCLDCPAEKSDEQP